jgi:hypothetical protein
MTSDAHSATAIEGYGELPDLELTRSMGTYRTKNEGEESWYRPSDNCAEKARRGEIFRAARCHYLVASTVVTLFWGGNEKDLRLRTAEARRNPKLAGPHVAS